MQKCMALCSQQGSNLQPSAPETDTLPVELCEQNVEPSRLDITKIINIYQQRKSEP